MSLLVEVCADVERTHRATAKLEESVRHGVRSVTPESPGGQAAKDASRLVSSNHHSARHWIVTIRRTSCGRTRRASHQTRRLRRRSRCSRSDTPCRHIMTHTMTLPPEVRVRLAACRSVAVSRAHASARAFVGATRRALPGQAAPKDSSNLPLGESVDETTPPRRATMLRCRAAVLRLARFVTCRIRAGSLFTT